ncbi:DUF4870 domain-containing protein [Ascidiimonas sp. W6]|uniref:DUF4870 domain-containing protein n=1 Tax=Ascidiimonas meishanensis TaxID=3128903 RepID=UPI0030ED60F3
MNSSITKNQKTLATITHLSTFSKYFFPFGNFIVPLILWLSNKNESSFVDYNGKQVLNFQISILIYSLTVGIIAVPLFLIFAQDFIGFYSILEHNTHNVDFDPESLFHFNSGLPFLGLIAVIGAALWALDVVCTIVASIKAGEGESYKYPLTINFIK